MKALDAFQVAGQVAGLWLGQWRAEDRVRRYQRTALVRALRHAVQQVPFYRGLGISADSVHDERDLARFPVLTKADVQSLGDDLLSDAYRGMALHQSRTSGSTGEPTTTYFDRRAWLLCKYALKVRRMLSHGVGPFRHVVHIGELSPAELATEQRLAGTGVLFRETRLSIHEPLARHLPTLQAGGIDAIYAFPSYLLELIRFCADSGQSLPRVPVVFTSSEVLQSAAREAIEQAFGAQVCDIYGSTEFKEVAWQCGQDRYHVNVESVWPEAPGQGESPQPLLLTTLVNRAMPLIRYQVGDLAELGWARCGCGRSTPVLGQIQGRVVDQVIRPDGGRVSPYLLTTAIESQPAIAKYQIVQKPGGAIEVRYVVRDRHELDEAGAREIVSGVRSHLGDGAGVELTSVAAIPRTERGKHRVFVPAEG